jgi:hypothetical protein
MPTRVRPRRNLARGGAIFSLATAAESAAEVFSFERQDSGASDGLATKVLSSRETGGLEYGGWLRRRGRLAYGVGDAAAVPLDTPVTRMRRSRFRILRRFAVSNGVSKELRLAGG